jgi:ABC-type multidrug transport system ATPase subunit
VNTEVADAPVLDALDLRHDYAGQAALVKISLKVSAGELVAMVGSNGAGKTTFLKSAAGLLDPTHGSVHVVGTPAGSIKARSATSYIPDSPALYDDLSLNEHVEFVARLHGVTDWQQRGEALLKRLSLARQGDDLPTSFSRGMRQKASIALGLVRPFSLLLADEPFDGLDPRSRVALTELLQEAAVAGAAVLFSTHRTEALDFATRCVAIFDGEVSYDGKPDASVIEHLGD